MAKLNLDKQEGEFLNRIISFWEQEHLVSNDQAEQMRRSYETKGFDWMRLAKYSFWIALICGGIAFASLLVNAAVLTWIKQLYYTPDIVISLASTLR